MPEKMPEKVPEKMDEGPGGALRYWDRILDPQNLEREADPTGEDSARLPLADEITFAATPDMAAARVWLEGGGGAARLDH